MDRLLGIQNVPTTGLSPEAVERVTTESRKEGVFAGLTSGLASVIIGQRLFGFKRNLALVSGVVGGVLSGYIFTQAFKDTAVTKLHAEEARLRSLPQTTESQPSSESALS
ncbi:hypothetical protein BJ165DRAFT_260600 [Panaeolus papilionaceus]|nr:hypothetical protein BJ165DRAFT_260600 [Panaeolus papilionaceus]